MKINSVSALSPTYPARLVDIPNRPEVLYYRGEIPVYQIGVAIVGTRKPTEYGKQTTKVLAERLAQRGAAIISGLAHGIDGIAHESAVKVGGMTIAVLPGGLETIYPSTHRNLAERILETGGGLVGEYQPGTPPLPHRFLERNRIISGLSDIIVVTEAGLRSGTMNTVSHALEQGRDIYAVPGPITSAMSAGCNALIAQGAMPIVNIDQFIESIFPDKHSQKQWTLIAQNDDERAILALLSQGLSEGETLLAESKLDTTTYLQTITMLEIRGVITSLGANRWSL